MWLVGKWKSPVSSGIIVKPQNTEVFSSVKLFITYWLRDIIFLSEMFSLNKNFVIDFNAQYIELEGFLFEVWFVLYFRFWYGIIA